MNQEEEMVAKVNDKLQRWKAISDRMKQGKGVTKLNQEEAINDLQNL